MVQAEVGQLRARIAGAEFRGEPLSLAALQAEAKTRHPDNAFIAPKPQPGTATE